MPTTAKPRETGVPTSAAKSAHAPRILAADDQQHILDAIELLLKPQGDAVETARSPVLVREELATNSYDAVLIDLNYTRDTNSGREGLDLRPELVAQDRKSPVMVMT